MVAVPDPAQLFTQLVVVGMIRERNEGEESAGLVLQVAQHRHVLDPVGRGLDVTVEHRAVGRNAELVRLAVHPDPLFAGELPVGDRGPHRRAEHFRAATGQAGEPRSLSAISTSRMLLFSIRARCAISTAVSALMWTIGVPLLEPADHVRVVAQPQLRVQAADDMELAGRCPDGLRRFVIHLFQRPGVGPVFLRHAREGAEDAGLPQDADVGRIEVLIGGEEDPVAVLPAVGQVGQPPYAEEVGLSYRSNASSARTVECQTRP